VRSRDAVLLAWPEGNDTLFWDFKQKDPFRVAGLHLNRPGRVARLNSAGDRILVLDRDSKIELWDRAGPRLKETDIPGGIDNAEFTLDQKAFFLLTEGGALRVYSADDGQLIAHLVGVGGEFQAVYYSPKPERINVWTSQGRVLRYERVGTTWLTRWFGGARKVPNPPDKLHDEDPEEWEP
jgi:hypothetical protein